MRARLDYTRAATLLRQHAGADVSTPVEGYYRHRLRGGGVRGGVEIRYGAPLDPVTGEELDRSWRWLAFFDGSPVDFDEIWPNCVGDPITADDYRAYCARAAWARQNAPDSAYADPRRRLDPLSTQTPLPF